MAVILVIGASRGIGLALVQEYAQAGWQVLATVRDAEGQARVQALGAQAFLVDVLQPESVTALATALAGQQIDLAMYVAGVIRRPNARTVPTQADFDAVMHTNVLGAMQILPQLAPIVEASGGVFAFISSSMSQIEGVDDSEAWLYRVSKAALNMAVASAQHDYPGARLIALDPGWVQTDMGGQEAPLTVQQSVRDMRQTLASVSDADKGRLLHHDGRRAKHW
ncbi:NAD(P)-dependent dehydrogenase (short-subunit alcohol dehydrogenase family) [Comamonas sp. BIGb0152]|uniref:SDR family oxidoreductase n=1 Tax=Comamonas sp. BIGb0152 TaxID=2940601 RepID=UPI002168F1F1|nr:SDR family oxidoreductase [Comamonas sp. BIGb0152]MCS4294910.1 NAD(P)-dependent dehydrogenase (short-subunit alcohol dehydrogenase family) [Comamonas sp. BIGb0152]